MKGKVGAAKGARLFAMYPHAFFVLALLYQRGTLCGTLELTAALQVHLYDGINVYQPSRAAAGCSGFRVRVG